jgi:hypothetical protein
MSPDKNLERLFKNAKEVVIREWGQNAFDLLGPRLQSALLAERILILVNQQDEVVPPEMVKRIATEGWSWVIEETNR